VTGQSIGYVLQPELLSQPVYNFDMARCFVHGIIVPRYDTGDANSLSNMLRLNFEATDKPKCEIMMAAYCEENIRKQNYSPIRLKGSFKPDVDKTDETTYEFLENCKVKANEN
jgi:hypothetical protein